MKSPLHILHLEDNPNDATLVESTLEADGISCATTCVQTRADFVAALERGDIDLIIADFSLPTFDGLAALEIAQKQCPEIPFILVSGTLGEEVAVDSLKGGATDYVLKQRLCRLGSAVRRAIKEATERIERKQLEEQFIQSQKMEVVGHLAGGVAHDFNNILSVIFGYADLLMEKLDSNDPLRKYAEEVRYAGDRAAALTRQLLVFSRKETMQPAVLDPNQLIKGLDKMLRRLINENVELTIELGEQIGRINADSGYFGQVLMNLVVNARDALPNGGRISIKTSNISLDENYAQTHAGVTPGEYVAVCVTDTGMGMTEEVKAQLFKPFFTTKPKDKGTGLGLATCQTIVSHSGGHIGVESEVGKGATFRIYFPQVDQPLAVPTGPATEGALVRGTETLLLVEDDPSLRHLALGVLQAHGYEVLRAVDGRDGLNLAFDHKGSPIRLVITDVVMPQMGGRVMADWLKTTLPDVKVLFTSGYTDDAIANHGGLGPGASFLPKPYTPGALASKVRELLDAPA